jgi:hypothetical protein
LTGANFHKAILNGANLNQADLFGADLSETDLSGAILLQARLTRTRLTGAIIENALCLLTEFSDIDLSNVKGLNNVRHDGPCTIGVDTLLKSKGQIPERFLRGCGVTEDFIKYIPSLTAEPFKFFSCFISYNSRDKSFARRLHDGLQGRGIRCWLDEKQIVPGDDIHAMVDRGVRLWDKVLLCASKDSLTSSWWVDNEIETAFQKEQRLHKERGEKVLALIPLDLDGFLFSDECEYGKKAQLKSRLAADFKGWETSNDTFEQAFESVVKALRSDDWRPPAPDSKL